MKLQCYCIVVSVHCIQQKCALVNKVHILTEIFGVNSSECHYHSYQSELKLEGLQRAFKGLQQANIKLQKNATVRVGRVARGR